ncbi:MAG: hypothetical protein JNN21_10615 [Candidatus Accumulibacter sp.]|nr:hypothetical protein [Accumulibacter sp.]
MSRPQGRGATALRAARGKRHKPRVAQWLAGLETAVLRLQRELPEGRWQPGTRSMGLPTGGEFANARGVIPAARAIGEADAAPERSRRWFLAGPATPLAGLGGTGRRGQPTP